MTQYPQGSQAEIIEWLMANDLLEHEGTPGLIELAQVGDVIDQAFARSLLVIHSRARGSVTTWIRARTTADTANEERLHAAD
ncbi:MAG: hypothetical protein QM681_09760 [Novosphingobium sp.]